MTPPGGPRCWGGQVRGQEGPPSSGENPGLGKHFPPPTEPASTSPMSRVATLAGRIPASGTAEASLSPPGTRGGLPSSRCRRQGLEAWGLPRAVQLERGRARIRTQVFQAPQTEAALKGGLWTKASNLVG